MKKNIQKIVIASSLYFIPLIAFAEPLGGLKDLIKQFGSILKLLIPIVFGLAFIFFFWGVAQFILHSGDSKTRDEGKQKMLWGVIALFVMFSIYGIIAAIGTLTGIKTPVSGNGTNPLPKVCGDGDPTC